MIAGDTSGYGTTWSASVEDDANRHLRPGQTSVTEVRVRAGLHLSEPGTDPERYSATSVSDQQVLADAVASQAMFIVTEDVDDFGEPDLVSAGIAAVNADLFLSVRVSTAGYAEAVGFLSRRSRAPHRTSEDFHRALGRVHPMTVSAHQSAFPGTTPLPATHNQPAELYRGNRCLICLGTTEVTDLGVCEACSAD